MNLILRQHNIAGEPPDHSGQHQRKLRGNMDYTSPASYRGRKQSDQFVESKHLGSCRVYNQLRTSSSLDHKRRHILDEDWLDVVVRPWNRENWKPAQKPGDIVDEDVFETKKLPSDG